jgi:hypothetical protein
MDWLYSFFSSAPVTAAGTGVVEDQPGSPVEIIAPSIPDPICESEMPALVPAEDSESLEKYVFPRNPVTEAMFPDPDEYSAEPDSKCQTKLGAEQEYQKRMNKRARNKARRQRGKISWDP